MIVKKRKGWNFDPNTWNGKFYIPYKIDKKKILEILANWMREVRIMRIIKNGDYFFLEIENKEELEKLKEDIIKKIKEKKSN